MNDVLALVLPLLLLLGLFGFLARGRLTPFSPRRADATFRSPTGPLAATWLALTACTWGLLDVAGKGWFPVPAGVLAPLLVAAVVGVVVAPGAALLVMALLGLAAQFAALADDHGPGTALAVVVLTGLVTWLFGAVRGVVAPRAGRR
ncbi:hypothetical protein [Trujillonella humicola]|uniref:hypothetical protein n=1 Tax=Trujillonella humicola TaxID=3383699 RepID=UPI003905A5EC